jgi:hypothetical protein
MPPADCRPRGLRSTLPTVATWPTVNRVCLSDVADCQPRGQCATCIKSTRLKRQPRVYYTWLTCRGVFGVTHGTVATWTRGKLYISQQPDLPRRAHVANYTWQLASGDLQVFL